ncbi:hypothetical protein GE09DRAFT_345047 [Coniochaeta sp. 2T2.1]|nr:hypothetical protein GE09DRAFT_345047 [Coniochaeta sp. 2T2.1]
MEALARMLVGVLLGVVVVQFAVLHRLVCSRLSACCHVEQLPIRGGRCRLRGQRTVTYSHRCYKTPPSTRKFRKPSHERASC